MTLLLVRHAVALRRRDWSRPDHLRPLTPRGERQAEALVDVLAAWPIARILTSPAVRCVDTVQPLAARLGLPVEELPELAEGAAAAAAPLLVGLAEPTAICTHGDVLPDLLGVLAPSLDAGERTCEKASTWVLEDGVPARYLPPPA